MQRRAASGSFSTSCPATTARPAVIGISVVIMRISVDLPAPFGPSSPKISSSSTWKVTSSTAVKSPYFLTMFSTSMAFCAALFRPFAAMAGGGAIVSACRSVGHGRCSAEAFCRGVASTGLGDTSTSAVMPGT